MCHGKGVGIYLIKNIYNIKRLKIEKVPSPNPV